MPDTPAQPYRGSLMMPSLEHASVADAMHPGILSCPADVPLADVARMMTAHGVHCIAVMDIARDRSGESLVWGIVSDLDLMRARIRAGGNETAQTLAKQPIITVMPSTPLREAGELMLAHDVSHLVVIEPESQRPVGILSTLDVVSVLAWGDG